MHVVYEMFKKGYTSSVEFVMLAIRQIINNIDGLMQ